MWNIKLNTYKKNILKLFTGTGIAQILPILSAPLLTRLYQPQDFGIYATFFAFSAIVSIIATFRLEVAIVIPKKDDESNTLLFLVLISSFAVSTLVLVATLTVYNLDFIDINVGGYIHLIALSVLVHSWYKGFYFTSLRYKLFNVLAYNRIIISISVLLLSITIPLIHKGPLGLIISNIVAYIIGLSILIVVNNKSYIIMRIKNLRDTFLLHKNYPIYDMPSALFIQLSNRLPIILLSNFFPIKLIGQYSLTQRMLDLPVSFISTAISDTFKQKASEEYNYNGECLNIFIETRNLLIILSIVPYIIIQFYSPIIFSFIFGPEWVIAGEYAQILALMFLLRFITGPLSYMFYIRNKMKNNMYGQIVKFIFSVIALFIGVYYGSIKIGLSLYAVFNCFIYIYYYIMSLNYAKSIDLIIKK